MKRYRLSQQIVSFLTAIAVFGMAATPTLSQTGRRTRAQSIVEQLERQFPSLVPQMQSRSQFTTKELNFSGEPRQLITPVEEEADTTTPAGLQPEEAAAWQAAAERSGRVHRDPLQLGYPARYDEVMVAEANGVRAELRALQANSAPAEIEDGKVVYREVYRGTDSIQVYGRGQSEEFLLLRDEGAPVSFEYELKVSEGAQALLDEGAVRLVNEQGHGLVIPRPWIVDAKGERREDVVRWELSEEWSGVRKLVLELQPAGLSYPVVVDPGWTATGSLIVTRSSHTATLLSNGKVLVVGGLLNNSALRTAELYDPATGVWTYTGNLISARYEHTATLLPNGKVLVVGGYADAFNHVSIAELYDPATGWWTWTSSTGARVNHTATLLPSGKVLIAGGYGCGWWSCGYISSAQLYDPATGVWSSTGSLNTGRLRHTATLLSNGKVLVAGGQPSIAGTTAELYDPATGLWTYTGNLNTARYEHTATLLLKGKVLVVGGYNGTATDSLNSAELYDPATGVWTSTGNLNIRRRGHTATLLSNGKVLVVAGCIGGNYLNSAELYDPAIGVWTSTGNLNEARKDHTATLLANGKVLVVGGWGAGYLNSAELYNPCPYSRWCR